MVGYESLQWSLHELVHISADSVQCMQRSILAWDHIDVPLVYVRSDIGVTLRSHLYVRDL